MQNWESNLAVVIIQIMRDLSPEKTLKKIGFPTRLKLSGDRLINIRLIYRLGPYESSPLIFSDVKNRWVFSWSISFLPSDFRLYSFRVQFIPRPLSFTGTHVFIFTCMELTQSQSDVMEMHKIAFVFFSLIQVSPLDLLAFTSRLIFSWRLNFNLFWKNFDQFCLTRSLLTWSFPSVFIFSKTWA